MTKNKNKNIHVQRTSIPHLMALSDGSLLLDLQPVNKEYEIGDSIIFKAYGDRYDQKLIKLDIQGIQKGWKFSGVDYQMLILDYPVGDHHIGFYKTMLLNGILAVLAFIGSITLICLFFTAFDVCFF